MTRKTWMLLGAAGGLFGVGVLYAPHPRIEVARADCHLFEPDDLPWILPAKKSHDYCQTNPPKRHTRRSGSFETLRDDALAGVDASFWDKLDTTFPCNQAVFAPGNVVSLTEGGIRLGIERATDDKGFTSGSIATKDTPEAKFTYGRFETMLKPVKVSGVITAFFLYRFDPWQEIDAEILGKDPTKILVNVYFNPGEPGDLYNYGYRGTPVVVDLGFDTSLDFHRYAIEWEPEEIRWFVDDRLIHVRHAGQPSPIPHLPMRLYVNVWPCCSEELAGPFDPAAVPTGAQIKSVTVSRWRASLGSRMKESVADYFSPSGKSTDWRTQAGWIHP